MHEVDSDFRPAYAGQEESLATGLNDRTVEAGRHDEALVGAFWIDDPFHVAYLGQDPRGQVRSYRFWNDGAGSDRSWLGVFSIDKRTSRQLAPLTPHPSSSSSHAKQDADCARSSAPALLGSRANTRPATSVGRSRSR